MLIDILVSRGRRVSGSSGWGRAAPATTTTRTKKRRRASRIKKCRLAILTRGLRSDEGDGRVASKLGTDMAPEV